MHSKKIERSKKKIPPTKINKIEEVLRKKNFGVRKKKELEEILENIQEENSKSDEE